ncbi:hypothetical protein ISCGN_011949 [Ixodes scapularis]
MYYRKRPSSQRIRSRENFYARDCSPRLLHFSLTSVLVRFDVTRHLRLADLANALAYHRRLGSKAKEVRLRVDLGHSCVEGCVSPASDLLSLSRFTFVVMASDAVPYSERIAALANLCILKYIRNAEEIDPDALTTFAAASAVYLKSLKKKKRRAVRLLLRSRKQVGEYSTLVRQMFLDPSGQDFFDTFRMTKARFQRLLDLVGPLLTKEPTNVGNTISASERLIVFLSDFMPTEQEKLLRTHNPGLALYEDTPDPPSDSPPY